MKSTIHRLIAVICVAVPLIARAHPGHEETATFLSGFLHPLVGVDHILAAIAVGLLAARSNGVWRGTLPATFVACMLFGFAVARAFPAWPMAEMLVAFSLIGLGTASFRGNRMPLIGMIMVSLFGAVHGYVHGTELPGEGSWMAYGAGLAIATAVAHAAGLLLGTRVNPRLRLAVKLVAAIIASTGAALLGMQLAG